MKLPLFILSVVALAAGAPTRGLKEDLTDILSLIPIKEIFEIPQKYINDPEVQEFVNYMNSPEWRDLVNTVANHPTWKKFKAEMLEQGVDIDKLIAMIGDVIGGLTDEKRARQTRSLKDMYDEMHALVPVDEVRAAIREKRETSPEFREFWATISSERAYALVQEIRFLPETQHIVQELTQRGFDVEEHVKRIYDLLGWEFRRRSTRSLEDDLHEIASLIPFGEIGDIVRKYIQSDAEVQEVVEYIKGAEFQELANRIKNHPTWVRFKGYMKEQGIDIDRIVQIVHDFIQDASGPRSGGKVRNIKDMFNEIVALIPIDEVLIALDDKIQNSEEFQEFWGKISGKDAYALAEELRHLPEIERLAEELRGRGLDIDRVAELIYGILGWEF